MEPVSASPPGPPAVAKRPLGLLAFLAGLLLCPPVIGKELGGLAGAYVDTLNMVNVKGGLTLSDPFEPDPDLPHYYGSFHYADIELGLEGQKLTVGVGQHVGHGLDRIGLSYARIRSQDLAGLEAVVSQMSMSVKLGYYQGLEGTGNRLLLGIGMGF